eukprot:COSAG05_NODE_629_length_8215_cov_26.328241_4_plen_153_part_00
MTSPTRAAGATTPQTPIPGQERRTTPAPPAPRPAPSPKPTIPTSSSTRVVTGCVGAVFPMTDGTCVCCEARAAIRQTRERRTVGACARGCIQTCMTIPTAGRYCSLIKLVSSSVRKKRKPCCLSPSRQRTTTLSAASLSVQMLQRAHAVWHT